MSTENFIQLALLQPVPRYKRVGAWHFYSERGVTRIPDEYPVFFEDYGRILATFFEEFKTYKAELQVAEPEVQDWEYAFEGLMLSSWGTGSNLGQRVSQLVDYLNKYVQTNKETSPQNLERLMINCSLEGQIRVGDMVYETERLFDIELSISPVDSKLSSQCYLNIIANNLVFLPNHPLLEEKQYELWAQNAPYLARCIQAVKHSPLFTLDLDDANEKDYGYPYSPNPQYLQNSYKTHFWKDWDETDVPLHLIGISEE